MTEGSVYRDIGERIRIARERAGMTQEQFGKFLGVSGPEVSRTEKGRRKVTIVELQVIASILDQSLLWLITGEKTTTEQPRPGRQPIPPEAQKEVETFIAYIWEKYHAK